MGGKLFVISAPSGTGKTRLLGEVMSSLAGLSFSISHTTREPRPGEKNGVDYHFVSRDEFLLMVENNKFLEYAEVHNNLYGTSTEAIDRQMSDGVDVILDIDVKGASILRADKSVSATQIFIAPPSLAELEKRLRGRGTESEEMLKLRLQNAVNEMAALPEYDYLMVNDEFDEACGVFEAIIVAERARAHRHPNGDRINLKI